VRRMRAAGAPLREVAAGRGEGRATRWWTLREVVCLGSSHHVHGVGVLPERPGTSRCAARWSRRREAARAQCSRAVEVSARTAEAEAEAEAPAERCTCRRRVGGEVWSCGAGRCGRCIMPLGRVVLSARMTEAEAEAAEQPA